LALDSKPTVKHSNFLKPVLVVQPGNDQMTPKKYMKKTFERLGSKIKKYVEVEGAPHFPIKMETYNRWANEVDQFIKKCK